MALILREDMSEFNREWKYIKGDIANAYLPDFNDSNFRVVSLPHYTRYVTDGDFKAYEGVSWYRKRFHIPEEAKGFTIYLKFDGIMQSSILYINGTMVKEHLGGYMGFCVDVTDYLLYGQENVFAVKADSRGREEFAPTANKVIDFQFHGGIYREVHLYAVSDVHITEPLLADGPHTGGVIITSNVHGDKSAEVFVSTTVHCNEDIKELTLVTSLYDNEGELVAESECMHYEPYDNMVFEDDLELDEAVLWDIDGEPYRYILESKVYADGELKDRVIQYAGIRTISWEKEGFFLNNRKIELNGINYHQDMYGIGNAESEDDIRRDLLLIKEAGFNFIRCSHYPHSPVFYDICDEIGILVMNSMTGWQVFVDTEDFFKNTMNEIQQMIRRDRNHPSIILWETSINEAGFSEKWGLEAHNTAHMEMDDIYTAAWKYAKDGSYPDVFLCAAQHGVKSRWNETDKPVIISEYGDWNFGGTRSTTRVSIEDDNDKLISQCRNLEESLSDNRKQFLSGQICGYCYWDFADYSPFNTEDTVIKCGIVSMDRLPKPSFFMFQSQNRDGVLYIADTGISNETGEVRVYSSYEEVELFCDDVSCGKMGPAKSDINRNERKEAEEEYENERTIDYSYLKHPPFIFKTGKYQGGRILRAVAYENGVPVCETITDSVNKADKLVIYTDAENDLYGDDSRRILMRVYALNKYGLIDNSFNERIRIITKGNVVVLGYVMDMIDGTSSFVDMKKGIGSFYVSGCGNGLDVASVRAEGAGITGDEFEFSVVECKKIQMYPEDFFEDNTASERKSFDIMREKAAYASSDKGGIRPEYGNSGNPGLWWEPDEKDENPWWMADAGDIYNLESVNIVWGSYSSFRYKIEAADSIEGPFTVIADKSDNKKDAVNTNDLVEGSGRFVKITIFKDENKPVKFNMFSVYGYKTE